MMNRILKWAAAGALMLGSVPAIGLARTHASLPIAAMTVTPTSLDVPVAVKHTAKSRHTSKRKVSSRRHKSSKSRRVHSKTRRSTAKHRRVMHKSHKARARSSRSA